MEPKEILTVNDVAEHMQVSPRTIYRWMKRGLPVIKVGNVTRIRRGDLEAFLQNHIVEAGNERPSGY